MGVAVGLDIWITLKITLKTDIQRGRRDGLMTRIWAIAEMKLGAGGAAEYLELVGL
ncbi:MAG: hypothetical protein MH252_07470 [Thermosynechococcaceae cyanobacterium MS004]|nr:hypothetical protein [Thermosynechococcaceae cyanobacterium MS004]